MSTSSIVETMPPSVQDPSVPTPDAPLTPVDPVAPVVPVAPIAPSSHGSGHADATSSASSSSQEEAPTTTEPAPTAAPTLPPTTPPAPRLTPTLRPPAPTVTAKVKAGASNGPSSAVLSVSLAFATVLIIAGCLLLVRSRRRRKLAALNRHNNLTNLGTPTISIELPMPSTTSKDFTADGSHVRYGGESLFNTNAPVISPQLNHGQRLAPTAYQPAPQTTYRLVDPSPSATPMGLATIAQTPQGTRSTPLPPPLTRTTSNTSSSSREQRRSRRQPDNQFGARQQPTAGALAPPPGPPAVARTISGGSTRSARASQRAAAAPTVVAASQRNIRDTNASEASTIDNFHDSMCDDLYAFGDGLGRQRAQSRALDQGVATVQEEDGAPSHAALAKTSSKKTLSIASMTRRAPPPPPPSSAEPNQLPILEELAPFVATERPTSVLAHHARPSEDPRDPDKPLDAIQRLSDVSLGSTGSISRPGSLVEFVQVVEVENQDGTRKEIEI
ncbi:hypothetical protein P43SY_006587 [Pythium insidiosum]|uniref:Uncharacterized protein n=1 Tax=Pythium insidiosum TaxID=114742 RepID=A0AAD5LEE1_PYTIN|nr:hypothetical protein P43SY_006587 [Pythium insidiosum]